MADMENARIIHAAGTDFRARQHGANPQALLLHGFGSDLHTWDSLLATTAGDPPCLRYDLRGFGQTPLGGAGAFSHAADLLAILDSLGLERVDLVGVSLGGSVALNFALDEPARVRKLVLISPALVGWEWSAEWRRLWGAIQERARAGDMEQARRLWWQHPLFATTRDSPAARHLFDTIMRFPGRQWIADEHRPMLPDIERIHTLDVPALLLTGERDLDDFRLIADLLAGAVPGLQRIDYPGLGHLLHLEAPERCAGDIRTFLGA